MDPKDKDKVQGEDKLVVDQQQEKQYSKDDVKVMVNKAREEVRKEEKEKLYKEIENLSKQNDKLTDDLTKLSKKFDARDNSVEEVAEKKALENMTEYEKVVHEFIKKIEETNVKIADLTRQVSDGLAGVSASQLDMYKDKIVEQLTKLYGDSVVMPQLIVGNTQEELDNSAKALILVIEKTKKQFASSPPNEAGNVREADEDTKVPPITGIPTQVDDLPNNVGEMTLNEFAADREKLLRQVSKIRKGG